MYLTSSGLGSCTNSLSRQLCCRSFKISSQGMWKVLALPRTAVRNNCSPNLFVHRMPSITFHIINQHARPTWARNSRFNPAHLVFPNRGKRVAPEIVIAQGHGDGVAAGPFPNAAKACAAEWYLAATADIALAMLASRPTLHTLWTAKELHRLPFFWQQQTALPF